MGLAHPYEWEKGFLPPPRVSALFPIDFGEGYCYESVNFSWGAWFPLKRGNRFKTETDGRNRR